VPAQCGPAAGKTARLTDRTIARLDTVIGYFEYTDVSVFGSLTGAPVCMVLGDEIDNYYDWQGDQIAFFVFTPHGDPVSTIVTDENLVLEGGASSSASRGGTLSFRDDALAAGAQAHFLARLGVLRANLRDAMMRRLMKLADPSGGPR
jgi:hypothetical protein